MEYYVTRANEAHEDELYHYGVKGMKWGGVRRKYPTVAQAHRIARKAGNEARKESIAKSRATDGGIGSLHRANRAANKARKEAYRNSLKEQHREIKEQKKANKKPMSTAKKVAIGAAATAAIVGGAYGAYKLSKVIKTKNVANAQKLIEQRKYLEKNIKNIQNHVDVGKEITSSKDWKHAYDATYRSRVSSIRGDNALYGNTEKYKKMFPNGRDADKETKQYMYDSLRNDYDYWVRRVRDK